MQPERRPLEEILVGTSRAMRHLRAEIEALALAPFQCALVVGETGVGKGLVPIGIIARARHLTGPLEVFDCAATAAECIESELFGTEAGAYPGAVERSGAVERAAGGILLVDEIAHLPLASQGVLLRLLDSRDWKRIGGSGRLPVRASIVVTTSQPLGVLLETGRLRKDLYFRLLQDVVVQIPPLAEHSEDIPLLARVFLADLPGGRSLDPDALDVLATAAWPGNVRQLRAVVRAAARLCPSARIDRMAVLQALRRIDEATSRLRETPAPACTVASFRRASPGARRKLLTEAIEAAGGNLTQAGLMLGLHERLDGGPTTLDLRARKRAHRKFRYWWLRLVGDEPGAAQAGAD